MHSALDYVLLAEAKHGAIPRGQALDYVWGDAAASLAAYPPDAGIVNLETSVTDCGEAEPKGINYRVSPRNAEGIGSLGIDCCVLANNHVLDFGRAGLAQTLETLKRSGVKTAGAGRDLEEAATPAVIETAQGRVLVFGLASGDSGVPEHWAASANRPGVNRIERFDSLALDRLSAAVARSKKEGDIAVASIHWGSNWGYDVPHEHVDFAHGLIDGAMIDLVHGHSSHHAKGWEIYRDKLILYGCGDFVNDYEGISGYEHYRGDLGLMYLVAVDAARGGALVSLTVSPFQMQRFRLQRISRADVGWLCQMLNSQARSAGARFQESVDGDLKLIGIPVAGDTQKEPSS
jgi:poly-gamma-glutamate synthesis protein (capsule biosynthesis protein)